MITLIIKLIKLFVVNRVAYAINEYQYIDETNSKYNDIYYRIEKVLIKDIFISNKIEYLCIDVIEHEEWGDTSDKVYFSKRKASKELLKLCNV
jgi:hypothetical protein